MISPVLEDLAGRHAGRLKVVKVDVDANPGVAARFGAQSIPLLVVIRDGREVDLARYWWHSSSGSGRCSPAEQTTIDQAVSLADVAAPERSLRALQIWTPPDGYSGRASSSLIRSNSSHASTAPA